VKIKDFVKKRSLKWKSGEIRKSTGHAVDMDKLHLEWVKNMTNKDTFRTSEEFAEDVEFFLKPELRSVEDEGFIIAETPEALIEQAIAFNNLVINERGNQILKNGISKSKEDLTQWVYRFYMDYQEDAKNYKDDYIRHYTRPDLKTTIHTYLSEREDILINKKRNELRFDKDEAEYVNNVLEYVIEQFNIKGNRFLARQTLKQWMWQVKQYLWNRETTDPLMVNLYGRQQGTGKTYFSNILSTPLRDFTTDGSFNNFSDDREEGKWATNYIVLFDELATGKGTMQEIGQTVTLLKKALTATTISYREMGTNGHITKKRIFSAFGTSNKSITSIIYDNTGMRRFFEMEIQTKPDQEFISMLGEIDPVRMWRGIDENLKKGYCYPGTKIGAKLRAVQDSYPKQDIMDWAIAGHTEAPKLVKVEEYLGLDSDLRTEYRNPSELPDISEHGLTFEPILEVRKRYVEWVEDMMDRGSAKHIPQRENFFADLRAKGYACIRTKSPTKIKYFIVSDDNLSNQTTGVGL
tara:strand:- start:5140 stop:6702 length:1563 start_codon:yes stop_codon:yes gene_type:complete